MTETDHGICPFCGSQLFLNKDLGCRKCKASSVKIDSERCQKAVILERDLKKYYELTEENISEIVNLARQGHFSQINNLLEQNRIIMEENKDD